MADLVSDAGTMRLRLELVDREAPVRGLAVLGEGGAPQGRYLAALSVDHFDRRDREWWALVRLPALHLPAGAVEALVEGARDLLAGAIPGFAWQPEGAPAGLQLGAAEGSPALGVEVALDLGAWLAEVGGASAPGGEACLFRFAAGRAELVRFADALLGEARARERDRAR